MNDPIENTKTASKLLSSFNRKHQQSDSIFSLHNDSLLRNTLNTKQYLGSSKILTSSLNDNTDSFSFNKPQLSSSVMSSVLSIENSGFELVNPKKQFSMSLSTHNSINITTAPSTRVEKFEEGSIYDNQLQIKNKFNTKPLKSKCIEDEVICIESSNETKVQGIRRVSDSINSTVSSCAMDSNSSVKINRINNFDGVI